MAQSPALEIASRCVRLRGAEAGNELRLALGIHRVPGILDGLSAKRKLQCQSRSQVAPTISNERLESLRQWRISGDVWLRWFDPPVKCHRELPTGSSSRSFEPFELREVEIMTTQPCNFSEVFSNCVSKFLMDLPHVCCVS